MAELKTRPTNQNVEDFLASVGNASRREDAYVLLAMMREVTGVSPVMWGPSIIGFGSYHYEYASGHGGDMPVIGFSPRSAAMSVYGVYFPGHENQLAEIGPYKTGASCLYLGRFTKLNLDQLRQAIQWAWNEGVPVVS